MKNNELKIVVPKGISELEQFAVDELIFFLKEIVNIDYKSISEDQISLSDKDNFIAIGNTQIFSSKVNRKDLLEKVDEDGYKIIMTKNNAIVCGGADQGTIFGVYGLLKELFNLKIYAETVYTFDKKPLEFFDKVIEEKPCLPMRTLGIYPVHLERRYPGHGNKRYCYRMRLRQMDEGWGINNHTYFRVLPPAIYKEKHPDWYDVSGRNLCLSNEEMTLEFIEQMKKIIVATPNDKYYMFGMQDVTVYCQCPECQKLLDKYNGFTGVTLYFANKCVKALNAWLKENYPEREVIFFTFGYSKAIVPPVQKQADGSYKLLYEDLRPADNFGILIAPLQVCANYALNDPRNYHCVKPVWHGKDVMSNTDIFYGWLSFVKHLAVWFYDAHFWDYLAPAPMWNSIAPNIRWCEELNAKHVFMEAGCGTNANFAAMKIYCASNLMWDTSLDINDLINDFMKVYFTGVEKELREYFDDIHEHAEWLNTHVNRQMIHVHFDDEPNKRFYDKRFWPIDVLDKWINMFDNMLSKNLSDDVRLRVRNESISCKFTKLWLYRDQMDKNDVLALMDDVSDIAKKTNIINCTDENPKSIEAFFEIWKKELDA